MSVEKIFSSGVTGPGSMADYCQDYRGLTCKDLLAEFAETRRVRGGELVDGVG